MIELITYKPPHSFYLTRVSFAIQQSLRNDRESFKQTINFCAFVVKILIFLRRRTSHRTLINAKFIKTTILVRCCPPPYSLRISSSCPPRMSQRNNHIDNLFNVISNQKSKQRTHVVMQFDVVRPLQNGKWTLRDMYVRVIGERDEQLEEKRWFLLRQSRTIRRGYYWLMEKHIHNHFVLLQKAWS